MRKIVDYALVYGKDNIALSETIARKLAEGYEPFGSPMLCGYDFGGTAFYQAVVKYAETKIQDMGPK